MVETALIELSVHTLPLYRLVCTANAIFCFCKGTVGCRSPRVSLPSVLATRGLKVAPGRPVVFHGTFFEEIAHRRARMAVPAPPDFRVSRKNGPGIGGRATDCGISILLNSNSLLLCRLPINACLPSSTCCR